MCVTLSTADDFEELTELWEASVRATHHFIPEQYILKLKPLVWSVYLRSMPVYTVRGPERIEGFMGTTVICWRCFLCTLKLWEREWGRNY